jgi:predicted acetyltransferase
MAGAAAGAPVAENEVDQARRIGQAWVEWVAVTDAVFSEWQGAHVTSPQPYHNPEGEVIAYMFAVEKKGKAIGHVLMRLSENSNFKNSSPTLPVKRR